MPGPDGFDRLRDLLGDVCDGAIRPSIGERAETGAEDQEAGGQTRSGSSKQTDPSRAIAEVWPEVAGADVAANATPTQLRRGRLVVSTSSSVWAHTLQYMADDLMLGLNARLGADTVKQVVFRHAGWEERPRAERPRSGSAAPRRPGPAGSLTQEQKDAIAGLEELDLPPDIKERIARAMKAAFVRGGQDSVR